MKAVENKTINGQEYICFLAPGTKIYFYCRHHTQSAKPCSVCDGEGFLYNKHGVLVLECKECAGTGKIYSDTDRTRIRLKLGIITSVDEIYYYDDTITVHYLVRYKSRKQGGGYCYYHLRAYSTTFNRDWFLDKKTAKKNRNKVEFVWAV